jgi:hypothetical protein
MLSHAGNMMGFTSEFVFLPERELGVVVLTNQRLSYLNDAVALRLFEMLFKQPYATDEALQISFNQTRDTYLDLSAKAERTVEPDVAALVVGSFTNDALGEVSISLNNDGVLIFDAGEFQSEMWLDTTYEGMAEGETAVNFLLYDPPMTGSPVRFEPDVNGVYQMILGGGVYEYAFERIG